MDKRIQRPDYLNRLIEFKDKDIVKIITGIRRCGKSTMLDLFADHLLSEGISEKNILKMNLESLRFGDLLNYKEFYRYVRDHLPAGEHNYLLFDELQSVSGWEKAVESFRLDFDADIYITGSNSALLSSEFSTLLSGRYAEIRMLPLSFKEFLSFYSFDASLSSDDKFQKYLLTGGMPVLRQFDFNLPRINEVLEGIYSTVVLRDILERNPTADRMLLQKITLFLADNIGSINSPNRIGGILSSEGNTGHGKNNIAGKTADKYIDMLCSAFIFYSVKRYDIKGKQLLKTLTKNYIADIGFRNMLLGYRDADRGHILENIVYLELLRRDYRISAGKVGDCEVDFVAEKPERKLYIQVAETLTGEETRLRELRPLKMIGDNYEKMILSMDKNYIRSYDGIQLVNILDFLLAE